MLRREGTTLPGPPFEANPVGYQRAPPLLGADTHRILTERLGLDRPQLDRLAQARIIQVMS